MVSPLSLSLLYNPGQGPGIATTGLIYPPPPSYHPNESDSASKVDPNDVIEEKHSDYIQGDPVQFGHFLV